MKAIAKPLGFLALALTILPPVLNATGNMTDSTLKALMLGGAVLWFATAPIWMRHGHD